MVGMLPAAHGEAVVVPRSPGLPFPVTVEQLHTRTAAQLLQLETFYGIGAAAALTVVQRRARLARYIKCC